MPDLSSHAVKIAEAAASAWWTAHSSGRDEIPLGVIAALALMTPAGSDPARLVLDADRDAIARLLRHVWRMFAVIRPELSIRTGPFGAWLDDPSSAQLDGAHAVACAAVRAGQLALTGDRDRACEVDLLGYAFQLLRNAKAQRMHGEMYTPAEMATIKARLTLADAEPGQSICDPYAGTGGLLRAAACDLRARGIDPRSMRWYAADIDPVVVAGLAVNVHLWDLGPHVVVGCADVLAEGDWEARAAAEQDTANEQHRMRVLAARALTFDRLMTAAVQDAGHPGQDPTDGTAEPGGSSPKTATRGSEGPAGHE